MMELTPCTVQKTTISRPYKNLHKVFIFQKYSMIEYMEPSFSQRVVAAALAIPPGKVSTYGDIARVCGGGGQAARSVNAILVRAYHNGQTSIPFHRIIYSNGQVWKSKETNSIRMKLYQQEGIIVDAKGYVKNFPSLRYHF